MHSDLDRAFAEYCTNYEKNYVTQEEYNMRRSLYEDRMRKIIEKSIINESFEIGENEFLDYTVEEIEKMLMVDKGHVVNGTANNFYEENMAYFEEMES